LAVVTEDVNQASKGLSMMSAKPFWPNSLLNMNEAVPDVKDVQDVKDVICEAGAPGGLVDFCHFPVATFPEIGSGVVFDSRVKSVTVR
jgi:hypothetical protein